MIINIIVVLCSMLMMLMCDCVYDEKVDADYDDDALLEIERSVQTRTNMFVLKQGMPTRCGA